MSNSRSLHRSGNTFESRAPRTNNIRGRARNSHTPSPPKQELGIVHDLMQLIDDIDRCNISGNNNRRTSQGRPPYVPDSWLTDNTTEEAREPRRQVCRGKELTGARCTSICFDETDIPGNGRYYCKRHDPRRRCQGINVSKNNEPCKVICSNIAVVEPNTKYYCFQHDPWNRSFQCQGFTKKRSRCAIICSVSERYNGVPYCNRHSNQRRS
ncbi:hypothetical protein BC939DRAFT_444888 [Gamsiella multidivaricata]|uniref:uncharacterized protein n=1 Tax=Gamsiella multidivaricata TaxID=101098 RepID=UPI0022201744|nr:uncharacterized protein BC939DRAFT_444888 [Gamsiella multidivaricata]KAI7827656.1 hypothetical protein BC939DRAFT_444888 [Gamsiella multidivaricata]